MFKGQRAEVGAEGPGEFPKVTLRWEVDQGQECLMGGRLFKASEGGGRAGSGSAGLPPMAQ